MKIIRGQLKASDVTPPNVRYSGDPPVFQTSYDGGETWVDTPSADPRHLEAAFYPPLTPYEGIQCDAAARFTAQLKDAIDAMCNAADVAQAVMALLELILLPGGLVGWMLSLLFIVADWIIDNGQETILAAFTTAVYDDIACILRCYIEDDGHITQDSLDAAWEAVKTAHAGTVATVIDEVRFIFTDAIFSNAGVLRTETGDCSGCDDCGGWPRQWNFCGTLDTWEIQCGTLESNGIKSVDSCEGSPSIIYIRQTGLVIPSGSEVTDISVWIEGTFSIHDTIKIYWQGTERCNITNPFATTPFVLTGQHWTGSGNFLVIYDRNTTGSNERIPTVRIDGTGVAPSIGHDASEPPCLT